MHARQCALHGSTIYNTQDMEAVKTYINRRMNKDVVHMHSEILLSHKKEANNAVCSDMGGTRDCHPGEISQKEIHKYMVLLIHGI